MTAKDRYDVSGHNYLTAKDRYDVSGRSHHDYESDADRYDDSGRSHDFADKDARTIDGYDLSDDSIGKYRRYSGHRSDKYVGSGRFGGYQAASKRYFDTEDQRLIGHRYYQSKGGDYFYKYRRSNDFKPKRKEAKFGGHYSPSSSKADIDSVTLSSTVIQGKLM